MTLVLLLKSFELYFCSHYSLRKSLLRDIPTGFNVILLHEFKQHNQILFYKFSNDLLGKVFLLFIISWMDKDLDEEPIMK